MMKTFWIVSSVASVFVFGSLPAFGQISDLMNSQTNGQITAQSASEEDAEGKNKQKRSYAGIGGNLGLSGDDTAIGDGGFTIVTRTRIIDYLSVRGSLIIGSETTSATALTGEVPITNAAGRIVAIPFLGGGISIGDGDVNPLISTGVDVPLSEDFTLTNRINVSFGDDETDVGALVGVGYNFTLF